MKKMNNILIFFILLIAVVLGDEVKIPHERITENPKMEVTTVESKKIKDSAKIEISVNKKKIEEIIGREKNGEIIFIFPKEKSRLLKEEEAIIVKSLSDLPNTYQKNKEFLVEKFPVNLDKETGIRTFSISKNQIEKDSYIALLDKYTGVINKVYRGDIDNQSITKTLVEDMGTRTWRLPNLNKLRINLNFERINNIQSPKSYGIKRVNVSRFDDYLDLPTLNSLNADISVQHNIKKNITAEPFYLNGYGQYETIYNNHTIEAGIPSFNDYVKYVDVSSEGYDYLNGFISTTGTPSKYEITGPLNFTTAYKLLGKHKLTLEAFVKYNSGDVYTNIINGNIIIISMDDINIKKNISPYSKNYIDIEGLSFYSTAKKDNIKIFDNNGNKISIDAKATIKTSKGSEIIIEFNQKLGEFAKGIVQVSNYSETQDVEIPLTIQSDYIDDESSVTVQTINLKLIIKKPVVIGEVEIKLDPRIKNISENWIKGTGEISRSPTAAPMGIYSELVEVIGDFNNLTSTNIKDTIDIEGRPFKTPYNTYHLFTVSSSSGSTEDEATMPYKINLNLLKENLMISKNNSSNLDMLNHRFTLLGDDGNLYSGNFKESYDETIPEKGYTGEGEVDLVDFMLNKDYRFDKNSSIGAISSASSTSNSRRYLYLTDGKLPQTHGFYNENIVTSLKVKRNGANVTTAGTSYENNNYRLELDKDSGDLIIQKKLMSEKYEDILDIEYLYNNIKLGEFKLKIKNSQIPIDIGEVNVILDPRGKNKIGRWINTKGEATSVIYPGNTVQRLYPEIVKTSGEFINLRSVMIKNIVGIENRPQEFDNRTSNQAVFLKHNSKFDDEAAMPYKINLSSLKENLFVSIKNSSDLDMLNHRFTLLGDDGNIYSGNFKEVYDETIPESGYTGDAKINLSKLKLEKKYTFMKNSAIGEVSSAEDSNIKLNLLDGKLPQTKGISNENIVTSLKVIRNGVLESDSGIIYENENYRLEFDVTGNLIITKKSIREYEDILEIEYMYKDIKLGQFRLNISGKSALSIVGDDTIDFGSIIQGKKSKIDGNIKIKSDSKIITVEINTSSKKELSHNVTGEKLLYSASINSYKQGFEIPIGIIMELDPSDNQEIGTYTGELNLVVTIE
ncbi:hypothetical protein [Cetobacterium sp.]|uniref:hypothetical protein n=1 Tax=Cetobacterium sp. TaxID=2071632 RepID=UPI003F2AD0D8